MLLDYSKFEKIVKFRKNKKQKIIIIDKLLRKNYENIVYKSIKVSTKKPTKVFKKKGKIIKYEFNDKKNFHKTMKILYKELNSKKTIKLLEKIFNIRGLYPDGNKLYSGLNISTKNAILNEHVDFNYNNKLKKFRLLNLLFYLNKNYQNNDGGKFYYRNHTNNQKKYILPLFNRAVIFMTNKHLPHGFTKVKKKRISLNLYFYTNKNLSLSKKKHKTLWN